MDSKKYIGMDVHKESISIAVMNGAGKDRAGMCGRDQSEHHSALDFHLYRTCQELAELKCPPSQARPQMLHESNPRENTLAENCPTFADLMSRSLPTEVQAVEAWHAHGPLLL
jgi:hypothetical protein